MSRNELMPLPAAVARRPCLAVLLALLLVAALAAALVLGPFPFVVAFDTSSYRLPAHITTQLEQVRDTPTTLQHTNAAGAAAGGGAGRVTLTIL